MQMTPEERSMTMDQRETLWSNPAYVKKRRWETLETRNPDLIKKVMVLVSEWNDLEYESLMSPQVQFKIRMLRQRLNDYSQHFPFEMEIVNENKFKFDSKFFNGLGTIWDFVNDPGIRYYF